MKKKSKKKRSWIMWGIIYKGYDGEWQCSPHDTKNDCLFYLETYSENMGKAVIKKLKVVEV